MDDLNDILEGEDTPAEAQQPPVEQEAPPVEQTAENVDRDEQGRFAPKGEEDAPPASEDKAAKGQEAALVAERRKRQEAQERLEKLERQFAELQAPKQPEQPPSMWEDEGKWQEHFGTQVVSTAVQQATTNAKLDMSEMMARQSFDDFEEVKAEFVTMMQENPALQQQALNDPHPWNRAYQIAKNARTMKELGATDIEGLKAKLLEQLKAEQAEQVTEAKRPAIPQSLAGEQSARGGNPQAATVNQSLDDILKG